MATNILTFFYLIKSSMKSFISSIDWYKLFSKNLIFGNTDVNWFLKVSRTIINAVVDIIITNIIFK